ncbi:hypothetical protein MUN88_19100 [Gracilibacillus caseinilyticus]|uniref:Phage minor structural protein GP20 n=1 Tax=Gracilibacillus caseinilyticus TaxID=2932256 RepID=A0ABY4EUP1_9BACI|nr:hypothetical protein [Gracilibacillus caseinilyticus]UOQ48127.1 hypothetical protein MUN88_19100 [Gracilibacillus caseinilyticus]
MAEKRIFTFEQTEGIPQHTATKVSDEKAKEIVESGAGVEISFGDYDQLEAKASKAYDDYKQKVKEIKESDNPLHTDEYKRWEISKLERQYTNESRALQREWEEKQKEMINQAQQKAAKATVNVTQADYTLADQLATRLALQIKGASNGLEAAAALKDAEASIKHLSDSEKVALQSKMDGLLSAIEQAGEKYNGRKGNQSEVNIKPSIVLQNVQDVRNPDLLAGKVADQLPPNVNVKKSRGQQVKKRVF